MMPNSESGNTSQEEQTMAGSIYDTITPKKGQDNHEGRCRALKNKIEGHIRQAERHLKNYGTDFELWKAKDFPYNYLTGQLSDYQKHVDQAQQANMEYTMFCNDQDPPPPLPVFKNVPEKIREASKKSLFERLRDSLPSLPPFPTDKQVEQFYKRNGFPVPSGAPVIPPFPVFN
jgi:hypothetical protein